MHAGDVVLTRLEVRTATASRAFVDGGSRKSGYLKIVALLRRLRAGVEQKGREAWVTPDQWSIYDTTEPYAVANPVRGNT